MADRVVQTSFNNPLLPRIGFVDFFNRADAATMGVTDREGKSWQLFRTGSTMRGAIVSGAVTLSGSGGTAVEAVDAYTAHGTLRATIKAIGNNIGGLAGRVVDDKNYYQVILNVGGSDFHYRLRKVVNGTATLLGTAATAVASTGDVVELVMVGNQISVKVNGVVAIPAVTDNTFTNQELHGIFWGSGGTATYEDVQFTAF
ncbi:hypothetical protein N1031_06980 [Herbiconiux moechotypicola]|uniref:3-keto-disaccharide hydrolase domain-containing protein n=1 Tax=Herbiconiux moechotypicola TaxID=637393 RepID=A0ABN3DGD9_9MICO|nr:hypothetical protein [Herbiconiux moechotypicola]MCS5729500.1 hypothetical protein [Herbiconiux moechotypicola]